MLNRLGGSYLSILGRSVEGQYLINHSKTVTARAIVLRNYSEAANLMSVVRDLAQSIEASKNPHEPRLVVSDEFRHGLEQRLKSSNFKSIAYKQDEFNQIITKLESPLNLLFMFDKYANEFNSFNLVKFTKKLAYFKRTLPKDFFIPTFIKDSYTNILIKHLPHLEAQDCFVVFKQLLAIGFGLNDYSIKAAAQILKYHVNELELNELISIKYLLDKSKPDDLKEVNEYVKSLERAVGLAVQIKIEELRQPKEAVRVLLSFPDQLSPNNFKKLVSFVNLRFNSLLLPDVLDLLNALVKKSFKHIKLCEKAAGAILRPKLSETESSVINTLKRRYEVDDEAEIKSSVIDEYCRCFYRLKFSHEALLDHAVDTQLAYLKSGPTTDANWDKTWKKIKILLKSLNLFGHKRLDLVEFLDKDVYKSQNEFPVGEFFTHAALVKYDKNRFTRGEYEKLLNGYTSDTDDDEIELIKSLCSNEQMDIARSRLNLLIAPENLKTEDKQFIKETFKLSYFRADETTEAKTKI